MSQQRAQEILEEINELEAAEAADGETLERYRTSIEEKVGDDIQSFIEKLLTESPEGLADAFPDVHPGELAKEIDGMSVEIRRINRRGDVRMRRLRNLMAEMSNFGGAL